MIDEIQKIVSLDPKISLVKPDDYVNNTGKTILALIRKGVRLQDILVVCDDVNLDFGKLRLRESGSAGGHHGLESVIDQTGSQDFARLRVGVRNASMPKDLPPFVLEPFTAEEKKGLDKIFEKAAKVCRIWTEQGFQAAQNEISKRR